MKINKQSDLPLQIYIPNLQTLQPFELEFYTNPSNSKTLNIVASYDGTTYTNCAPWEKGVYICCAKKLTNTGDLLCRATYFVPSPMVKNGIQKVVIDKIETGITLVAEGGSYFDPVIDPSKLKIPSFNDPTCSHIPVFMTYYPGAEKGDQGAKGAKGDKGETGAVGAQGAQGIQGLKGDKGNTGTQGEKGVDGNVGFDKSILAERLIPGEYFVGRDGTRKQVYGRLINITATVISIESGAYCQIHQVIVGVDTIAQVSGSVILPYMIEGSVNAEQICPYAGGYDEDSQYYIMIPFASRSVYWGDNSIGLSLGLKNPATAGLSVKFLLYFKYTKL